MKKAKANISGIDVKTCVEYGFDRCWSCSIGNSCPSLWIMNLVEAYQRYKSSDELKAMLIRVITQKRLDEEAMIMTRVLREHFPEYHEWLEKILVLA